MDVKVRSGKERRVVEISYDVKFKKDDDASLKRETMQSQPNRDKFQELEADERKKSSHTLQISVYLGRSTGERTHPPENPTTVVIPCVARDELLGSWPNNLFLSTF